MLIRAAGTGVNMADKDGRTALLLSSYGRHTQVVSLLIGSVGITVSAANEKGWTALIWSSYRGHTD